MDLVKITFVLESSKPHCPFDFTVSLDGSEVARVSGFDHNHRVDIEVPLEDGNHAMVLEMQGKTPDHTQIDSDGNIVDDFLVSICEVELGEVSVGQAFLDHSVYCHDFNGSQPQVSEPFSGHMGCNGTVTFEFSTPAYLWLLENL